MIEYKIGLQGMEWPKLFEFYKTIGMMRRLVEAGRFDLMQTAFERSYKVATAWDGQKLVAAGRMLSDGICYGSIFDVGVLPEYRKKGVGKGLMLTLLQGDEEHMPIHLTSTFGNEEFYRKLGFRKHKTAYSKYPFETEYLEKES